MANNGNDLQMIQSGPWYARILTNKNAVIALVALYLMYYVTGVFDTRLRDIAAVEAQVHQAVIDHDNKHALHDMALRDLMIRLVDQSVVNTKLQREICASNAKNSTAVRKCYDPDVK